jgi:hypothetical protein
MIPLTIGLKRFHVSPKYAGSIIDNQNDPIAADTRAAIIFWCP